MMATRTQTRQGLRRVAPRAAVGVAGAVALASLAYAYARNIERHWLDVTEHEVLVPRLPPAWEGARVVQLTDLHLGTKLVPHDMLRRAVATTVAARPDLIVLTGDYSDDGHPQPLDILAPLAQTAPTFAVLGNHDFFCSPAAAQTVARDLEALGIRVLRNDAADVTLHGATGLIAGFDDDRRGRGADLGVMLARVRGAQPIICLTHEPDVIDRFPVNWAGLTLAGHTHGAQVSLSPIRSLEWIRFANETWHTRYPRGWYTVNGNQLYVNRGLGVTGLPIRFGARPELAIFTLKQA